MADETGRAGAVEVAAVPFWRGRRAREAVADAVKSKLGSQQGWRSIFVLIFKSVF